MKRLPVILSVAVVLLAPGAMLYPLWTNPLSAGEDDLVTYYPLRKSVGQSLSQGRWPLENGLEATGMPLMGDPQAAVMFPMTWLFAIVPARTAYAISIFATFSLAGLGALLYLRRLGLTPAASTFGAIAFQFSGFMVGHRVHLNMIQTAVFFPWGLWGLEGLPRRPGRSFAELVPVGFLAIAAGHWGILSYMALAWAAYLVLRVRPPARSLGAVAGAAALAAALAMPQIVATLDLYRASTRQALGYAAAGENSLFPAAGVLAFFPFLMGSRTPNFFPQRWWGTWHLCEMLGYVGLATLVLAAAAGWKMYRKAGPGDGLQAASQAEQSAIRLVRVWVWIAAAAGVWMVGYYLPTFWLIYRLPIIGKARCPARMLLVADMALATLAALAVDRLSGGAGRRLGRLRRSAARIATFVLPAAMLGSLLLVAIGAVAWRTLWPEGGPAFAFFGGTADDALRALKPSNPAVWVPLLLAGATLLTVRWYLAAPARRGAAIIFLLLADLFVITRFVDVDARRAAPDCDTSPAAAWLRSLPASRPYRVYGLARSYCDRPVELLLPKAGHAMEFATIASYGAWQSPSHAHLFGFDRYGHNTDWQWLIRRNHLLSLYGVRYILACEGEFRDVIESVRIALPPRAGRMAPIGAWQLRNAHAADGRLRLVTPFMWRPSEAWAAVSLDGGKVYTAQFEARGPDGGAANYLGVCLYKDLGGGRHFGGRGLSAIIGADRIGPDWRRFEWTFTTPAAMSPDVMLGFKTLSERSVEVRDIRLQESHIPLPINISGKLGVGQRVYKRVAELPPINSGDGPVAIYENLLWQPAVRPQQGSAEDIERLKWPDDETAEAISSGRAPAVPDVSISTRVRPGAWLRFATAPALGAYAGLLAAGWALGRRRGSTGPPQAEARR